MRPNEPVAGVTGVHMQHPFKPKAWLNRHMFEISFLVYLVAIVVLFSMFVTLDATATIVGAKDNSSAAGDVLQTFHPIFQDIQVMIFLGVGFLLAYLRHNTWTSIGQCFFAAAVSIPIYILFKGFWYYIIDPEVVADGIKLNIQWLINGDFCAATIVISFGALVGKMSNFQLLAMSVIEVFVYSLNETLAYDWLKVRDVGGTIVVHIFAAYFGLVVAWIISPAQAMNHPRSTSGYNSNIFAMIGTIFLWIYWPSFNCGLADPNTQHRAILNTFLSLTGSCLATFFLSSFLHEGKWLMEHIQNATLAGGVAIGAASEFCLNPWAALLVGAGAGVLCTLGYEFVSAKLQQKLKLHDTAGINNLHGMPGLLGGFLSVLFILFMTSEELGVPPKEYFDHNRSSGDQAIIQLLAMAITFGIAVGSGIGVGIILNMRLFKPIKELFDDNLLWVMEENESLGETKPMGLYKRPTADYTDKPSAKELEGNVVLEMNALDKEPIEAVERI